MIILSISRSQAKMIRLICDGLILKIVTTYTLLVSKSYATGMLEHRHWLGT